MLQNHNEGAVKNVSCCSIKKQKKMKCPQVLKCHDILIQNKKSVRTGCPEKSLFSHSGKIATDFTNLGN